MNKDYTVFKKYVLFRAEAYLRSSIDEGLTTEPAHKNIVAGIARLLSFGRFNKDQFEEIKKFEDESETMNMIRTAGFSHVVYSLQLLKRYVDDIPRSARSSISIGVSNRTLKKGRDIFIMDMLRLKESDKEKYTELKALIDNSVDYADKTFDIAKEALVK